MEWVEQLLGSPTTFFLIPALCLAVYTLYRCLLPRPIPGIPYNPSAVKSLLGDLPDMIREVSITGDLTEWLRKQVAGLNSPVVQVFIRPFGKPFIVMADFRESQDVMARRKEFDRSKIVSDLVSGPVPNHHFMMPTNEQWKAQRRLLQDLMTPTFLNNVAAPAIYKVVLDSVDLWRIKSRLANERPFSADLDFYYTSLDAVLAFSFGTSFKSKAARLQADFLSDMSRDDPLPLWPEDEHTPVAFPMMPLQTDLKALLGCASILDTLRTSFAPKLLYRFWISQQKWYKAVLAGKNRCIREQIEYAVERLHSRHGDDSWVRAAVDLVISREQKIAEKEGRQPQFASPVISDEVYGFIMAGHETTSTTMLWGVKLLTDHPDIQSRLRSVLRSAHREAMDQSRQPTVGEIIQANCSYLDAVIEEILRHGAIPAIARDVTSDTQVLGYHLPKGSLLFMLPNGPSFQSPAFAIEESRRSKTSQATKRVVDIDYSNLNDFNPDRWLVEREGVTGEKTFDPAAGPQLAFGWGARSCFGKRLAYLELKIVMTLFIWNFELLLVPESLSSYDAVDCGIARKPKQCFVKIRQILPS